MELDLRTIIIIVAIVLGLLSGRGLFKTLFSSTGFIFWPILFGVIGFVVGMFFCGIGAIPGVIIGGLLGFFKAFRNTSGGGDNK